MQFYGACVQSNNLLLVAELMEVCFPHGPPSPSLPLHTSARWEGLPCVEDTPCSATDFKYIKPTFAGFCTQQLGASVPVQL